ncbi:MAG: hypothetical protein ABIU84_16310 [Thermoanaerobaculia bacterium]
MRQLESFSGRGKTAIAVSLAVACAALAAAPAKAVNRRAFATSIAGTGNIATGVWPGASGATVLDKADSVCRSRAAAGGLPNAATYRAWLSTSTVDAYCHVQGLGGQKSTGCGGASQPGGGPWYLENGVTPFSPALAELTGPAKTTYRGVLLDEFGDEADFEASRIWTGTTADGVHDGESCLNWTSANSGESGEIGNALDSAFHWTSGSSRTCDGARRLLCFEPGESAPFHLGWSPGALAFVSSQTGMGKLGDWPQAGAATGLAAGDAICRNLAATAHLPAPESFVAWLSDSANDARDRVTVDASFRRVDHYPIASSHADLIDGVATNSLHVDENGSHAGVPVGVQTGTFADGTATSEDCNGWTSDTVSFDETFGSQSAARSNRWTEGLQNDCSLTRRIYCFSNVVTLFWDGFESSTTARWSSTLP